MGGIEGFCHVGELRQLWRRRSQRRGKCGCGSNLDDCPFWTAVLDAAFLRLYSENSSLLSSGAVNDLSIQRAFEVHKQYERLSFVPWRGTSVQNYSKLMEALLWSISEVSGSHVIVDSSKLPSSARYLPQTKWITPFYLHLIRDSRGSLFSRQRKNAQRNGKSQKPKSMTTIADSLRWLWTNCSAERFRTAEESHYIRIRYEDFANRPVSILRRITKWVGEEIEQFPITENNIALLDANHTVWGNRNRLRSGEVIIRQDEEWKHNLKRRDLRLISCLTFPGLLRYGYHLEKGL